MNRALIFLLLPIYFISNNPKIDSLLNVLNQSKDDTNKVKVLYTLVDKFSPLNSDSAMRFAKETFILSNNINYNKGRLVALQKIGKIHHDQNQSSDALKAFVLAIKLADSTTDKVIIGECYCFMGMIEQDLENYNKAITNYYFGTNIMKQLNNKLNLSACYANMGNCMKELGNYSEALKFQFQSLKIDEELKDKVGISFDYENIANIFMLEKNYDESIKYHLKSIQIKNELNDKKGTGISQLNLSGVYSNIKNFNQATKHLNIAKNLFKETNFKYGLAVVDNNISALKISTKEYLDAVKFAQLSNDQLDTSRNKQLYASNLINIGIANYNLKNFHTANSNLVNALKIAKQIGDKNRIQNVYTNLAEMDSLMGNFKSSLANYKLSIHYRDSLNNEESNKRSTEIKMNYAFEKKELQVKAEQEKKDLLAKAQLEEKVKERNYFIAGFGIVIVLSLFIFRGYKQKQKANIEITEQKKLVEEKQKEILDSIHYAKRIQMAQVPSEKRVQIMFQKTRK